jgi:hypothetical protein
MLDAIRAMPTGIRLFLLYAFLILAGIGLSLRFVVDQAIEASVSFQGVVVMALLAYTIFTTTLVLQRKEAARGLAIGQPPARRGRLRCGTRTRPLPGPPAAGDPDLPERALMPASGASMPEDGTLWLRAARGRRQTSALANPRIRPIHTEAHQ